jgi:hypothetical protein
MRLKNSTLITLTACIAGAALLFGYFSYYKKDALSPAEPRTAVSEQSPTTSSSSRYQPAESAADDAPAGKITAGQTYKPAESDSSNAPPDETRTAEQSAPEECADSACAERILAFLADPANDEAAKVKMAQTWLKPESKEETLSLLRLLQEAHDAQQHDLESRLLQMLAGADSRESAELLISVLNGDEPSFVFNELPEDLQYQIKKAIRLNPYENIGKRLAEEFSYQRSDETIAAIQDIKRPDMIYELLAQETDQEKISGLVQSLQSYPDPRTLDVIMRLGNEQILTVDDAAKAAYNWADAHSESFNQERCEAYLSEPEASPAQRAVAAAALAAASDPVQAMTALQKAYEEETNQELRLAYEKAINLARSRMPSAAQ